MFAKFMEMIILTFGHLKFQINCHLEILNRVFFFDEKNYKFFKTYGLKTGIYIKNYISTFVPI